MIDMEDIIGKRIRMTETMSNDPHPIQEGEMGVVRHVGGGVINVDWDNGRTLGVVMGEDKFEIFNHPDSELPSKNKMVFSGNV
jgi:hypothetical protein